MRGAAPDAIYNGKPFRTVLSDLGLTSKPENHDHIYANISSLETTEHNFARHCFTALKWSEILLARPFGRRPTGDIMITKAPRPASWLTYLPGLISSVSGGGQRRTLRHRFLRLCAAFVVGVAALPATSAAAVADPGADLSATATWVGKGAPRAAVGDTVTYAITLTNLGTDTATGTFLVDQTPDQFNFVSKTCSDATFCSSPGGDLAPGATVTATFVFVVCCFPEGESRTTSAGAIAISTPPDSNLANNNATVVTKIVGPHGFFPPSR